MSVTPRILWQNFSQLTGVALTASSKTTSMPVSMLGDPLRSQKWRSLVGWNIVAGFNDELDFTEGVTGDATATLTPGNYATGTLLAAEIQTQLNAAATDNTYTVTYSTTTFKFTFTRATGAATFGIEWSTGSNATSSCGLDLGFAVAADDTGATTYTSDEVSYHTREWVKIVLPSAQGVTAGVALDHNLLDTSATITLEGHTSDAWTSPDTSEELTNDGDGKRIEFFTESIKQFWRFVIDDVQNPVGYSELGVAWVSDYTTPSTAYNAEVRRIRGEQSKVSFADQGAGYQDAKPTRMNWRLIWGHVTVADKTNFETIGDYVTAGRPFFFAFDPTEAAGGDAADDTYYVFCPAGITITDNLGPDVSALKWRVDMPLAEALG